MLASRPSDPDRVASFAGRSLSWLADSSGTVHSEGRGEARLEHSGEEVGVGGCDVGVVPVHLVVTDHRGASARTKPRGDVHIVRPCFTRCIFLGLVAGGKKLTTGPEHAWTSSGCWDRHSGPLVGRTGTFPSTTILSLGTWIAKWSWPDPAATGPGCRASRRACSGIPG